jgi:hypothetical protein
MDLVSAMALVAQRKAVVPPVWESAIAQGAPADGRVQINSAGIIESALCPVGISPAVGDVVAIVRAAAPLIVGVLVQADPDSGGGDNPPPPPTIETGTTRFPALYTKTWEYQTAGQGGAIIVHDGITISPVGPPHYQPYWYYQQSIRSALSGVTVDAVRFRVPRRSAAMASITLRFYDVQSTWPAPWGLDGFRTAPSQSGSAPLDATVTLGGTAAKWIDLPTTVGQALVSSTLAVGVSGPDVWVVCDGLSRDPQSGLLEITWHR